MGMTFPEAVLRGEFSASLLSAVARPVTDYSLFVRRPGQMLCERFFYIDRGVYRIGETKETMHRYTEGDILYLPYDVTYCSRWEKEMQGAYISVTFSLSDRAGKRFSLGESVSLLTLDRREQLRPMFRELSRKWERGSYGYRLECASLLYALLYRAAVGGDGSGPRGMDKAILYLENHYRDDLRVQDLAEMAGVGECMFRRSFRQTMGVSPVQYRNHLRLTKAREMLQSGEYTVLEAAVAAGFDDPGYFSRLFKREFGVPPVECVP